MSLYNAYMTLSGAIDANVVLDERLSQRTSMRIGGPAGLSITTNTYPALIKALAVLDHEQVEWVILGRGSNVLVSDQGYQGCVIRLGREFSNVSLGENGLLSVGAGMLLSRLVTLAQREGLSGLEPCVGIPGTVGGAISMNAGTSREWIGAIVATVITLKPGVGLQAHDGAAIEWGYRHCSLDPSEIILEANLQLAPSNAAEVAAEMNDRLAQRQSKQPIGKPSCGSVFKNPPGNAAGALIESCGLKGMSAGAAQISEQHANFIINNGGARAVDVLTLMRRMHDDVLKDTGIDLEPEVKYLGFT